MPCHQGVAFAERIGCRTSWAETVGVSIPGHLRNRGQPQQVQSLHCAVLHYGNAERALRFLSCLLDVHPPQR